MSIRKQVWWVALLDGLTGKRFPLRDYRNLTPAGRVLFMLFVIGVINFIAFFINTFMIGGNALSGYANGGHYFVRNEGRVTEISAAMWTFSWYHTISVFVTHPLAMIS